MCLWRTWMTLLEWTQCTEPLQQLILLQGKSQRRKHLSVFKSILNSLSPKSGQHQISPCSTNALLNRVVVRIIGMITQGKFSWYFINCSPLLQQMRIQVLILGFKGLMIEIENSQDFPIPFWFPRKMASEEQSQKFHTGDVPLPSSASDWLKQISVFPCGTTNQKHHPDLGSETPSVWNFCSVFLGYHFVGKPVVVSWNVSCVFRLEICLYPASRVLSLAWLLVFTKSFTTTWQTSHVNDYITLKALQERNLCLQGICLPSWYHPP